MAPTGTQVRNRARNTPATESDRPLTSWIGIVALAAFAILLIMVGVSKISGDDDIFWHLTTGKWIVEHKTIPSTDVLGHADPTQEWIPFEWGWDVLSYSLYSLTGTLTSVQVIPIVVWLAVFLLLYLTLRRSSISMPVILITLLLTLMASLNRYTPRPHVITVLGLTVILFLYFRYRSGAATVTSLYAIPVVTLFWANMHLGVLNGMFLLALILGTEVLVHLAPRGNKRSKDARVLTALPLADLKRLGYILLL